MILTAAHAPAQDWTPRAIVGPPIREGVGMVYDMARTQMVLFGGVAPLSITPLVDTWTFDGTSWNLVLPATSPQSALYHAMSYDIGRSMVTMFGGLVAANIPPTYSNETWEWDGTNWTLRIPTTQPPSARIAAAMAYDPGRAVTVMFGGFRAPTSLAETWQWDGLAWTQVTTNTTPPARSGHTMAFDASRGTVVMFGGSGGSPTVLNDTWEYDGTDWSSVTSAQRPPGRTYAGMAYDMGRSALLLHGGMDASTIFDDTWELRDGEWYRYGLQVVPAGAGRRSMAMAHDAVRAQTVMFGGAGPNATAYNDTWEFGGALPSWASYGAGCSGSAGTPLLTATSLPAIGGALDLQVTQAPANALLFLLGSFDPVNLPVVGTACRQHVMLPAALVGLLTTGSTANFSVQIPNSGAFAGIELYFQALVPDPVNALGVITSNAGRAVTN